MPANFYLGKGLSEPVSPYRTAVVFGAALNQVFADNWNAPPVISGATTTFDLSSITKNHEVVVALCNIYNLYTALTVHFIWRKKSTGAILFSFDYNIPAPQTYGYSYWAWYYCYSYLAWVDWEINENGEYSVEISSTDFTSTLNFTVTGIPAPVVPPSPPPTPPPPSASFMSDIIKSVTGVSILFYSIYLEVYGWVWPFSLAAPFFYYISESFSFLSRRFLDLSNWLDAVALSLASMLSWDTIWSYILSYVPNLTQLRDWFYDWWGNISSFLTRWWSATSVTVQGWITAAVQSFNDMLTAWNNFWNSLWPQFVAAFYSLQSSWNNFWQVTFPNLVNFTWLTTWWNSQLLSVNALIESKLKEWFPFYDDLIRLWADIAEFFTNPWDYLWSHFINWFLGPEG